MPAVFDALTEALIELPGLEGVQVLSGPVGPQDTILHESIFLTGALPSVDDPLTEGNYTRSEDYVIDGVVWAVKPGAGEWTIKAVRDRAFELLGEVEGYLRTTAGMTLGGLVMFAQMARKGFAQGIHTNGGRWCQVDFGIRIQARLAL